MSVQGSCWKYLSTVLPPCLALALSHQFVLAADIRTTTSVSHVRQPHDATRARSAHGHARFDFWVNRLSTFNRLTQPAAGVSSQSRLSVLSKSSSQPESDQLLITAGTTGGTGTTQNAGNLSAGRPVPVAHYEVTGRTEHREHGYSRTTGSRTHMHAPNIPGTGNQGIGDGPNVSVSSDTTPDELKNSTATFVLHQGTAFSAHVQPVRIKTDRGEINIAGHSVVYVIAKGKSVSVYNVADHKSGDVFVKTPGQRSISLKAGEQLLLTDKENSTFEKADPAPEIRSSRTKELATEEGTRIFNAEFSPTAVLDHAHRFQEMIGSKSQADRALVKHILKTAAVVMMLRNSGP